MTDSNLMDSIFSHAITEYPYECCGMVIENNQGDRRTKRCRNMQNDLHEKDPDNFPRDARTAYYIDSIESLKIMKSVESAGEKIIGYYHSHPDHDAYFSESDKKLALFDGEPAHPDIEYYIVVSVFERKIKEALAYQWNKDARKFLKVEF